MKRTATTLALLAGFGGGCMSTDGPGGKKQPTIGGYGTVTRPMTAPGYQGPAGEPVPLTARGTMPTNVVAASGFKPAGTAKAGSGVVQAHMAGVYADSGVVQASGFGPGGPIGPGGPMTQGFGPTGGPWDPTAGQHGILPVPGMGPPGAVAAVGAIVPGMKPAATNQRTSIRFTGPAGMKITWQLPGGGFNDETSGLTAPKEYNFLQAQVYRLRLTQVLPNFPGRSFYPTLEVAPVTPKTLTFLAHSSVPVTFADEDFRQAADGNLVVKVIYLPDPQFQDFAVLGGAEEIVSTRLEPGADPVAEAQRRGTILAVIRLGNIDLENRASPAMTAPPPGGVVPPGGAVIPPGAFPAPVPPKLAVPATPGLPTSTAMPPLARPAGPGPLPPAVRPTTLPSFAK